METTFPVEDAAVLTIDNNPPVEDADREPVAFNNEPEVRAVPPDNVNKSPEVSPLPMSVNGYCVVAVVQFHTCPNVLLSMVLFAEAASSLLNGMEIPLGLLVHVGAPVPPETRT